MTSIREQEEAAFTRVETFLRGHRSIAVNRTIDEVAYDGAIRALTEEDLDLVLDLAWRYLDLGR